MTTLMKAPSTLNPGTPMKGLSQAYTIDANGFVAVAAVDVVPVLNIGFTMPPVGASQSIGANGLVPTALSLMLMRTATGLVMTATPGAGVFGISVTPGTSLVLTGETATSGTKTDKAIAEYVLPENYVAGQDITVTVSAKQTGTATVKTIDCEAWEMASVGTAGTDLCATAVQSITTSNADYAFTITGTNLSPGDRVMIQLTSVSTEAAAGNTNAAINSVRIS